MRLTRDPSGAIIVLSPGIVGLAGEGAGTLLPRLGNACRWLGSVLVALPLAACPLALTPEGAPISPDVVCTPSVAGIVSEVETQPGGTVYTLEDGEQILIAVSARAFGSMPSLGDLFMSGESEECRRFRARAIPRDLYEYGACLGIGQAAIDDGDFVIFQDGLRVPKAQGFEAQARYVSGVACLNERGEIIHYSR